MKKMMRKRTVLAVAVAAIFLFSFSESLAAKKINIKLTTIQLPKQQMGKAVLEVGKRVKKQLGDRVNMRVYTSAQLYRGKEEIEALMRGELQMSFVIGSRLETIDPAYQSFKLPYLYTSVDAAYKVFEGPMGKEIFARIEKANLKYLGIVHSGNVVFSNAKRPLLLPKDFKGLKIRSYGRMGKDTAAGLGATAVVTASSETFSALQTGVIDGVMTPNSVYLKRKYDTIQKYVTDAGMLNFTNVFVLANLKFWNGLPNDIRSELTNILNGVIAEMRQEMKDNNEKIFDDIRAAGNEVFTLTPQQVAVWKKTLRPLYDKYGPSIGIDLVKRLEKEIAKYSN